MGAVGHTILRVPKNISTIIFAVEWSKNAMNGLLVRLFLNSPTIGVKNEGNYQLSFLCGCFLFNIRFALLLGNRSDITRIRDSYSLWHSRSTLEGIPMKPIRVQRKTSKGYKTPESTVYVGRGSRWGNPFKIGVDGTAEQCVQKYAAKMLPYTHKPPNDSLTNFYISEANLIDIWHELRGKNLSCWCKIGDPCHADWLLDIANAKEIKC